MMTTITAKTTTALEGFYQEVLADSVLQEHLKAATDAKSLSEIAVRLGQERGYFFTEKDVLAAIAIETAMGNKQIDLTAKGYGIQAQVTKGYVNR